MNQEQLNKIPTFSQRQDSVSDQLSDLVTVANKLGMFDAADAIKQIYKKLPELKYRCIVESCDCVIDHDDYGQCSEAKPGMRKEQCKYWRIIK